MIVKIGDQKFDSEVEPIMVILTTEEKEHITSMPMSSTKYCSFPEGTTEEDLASFMEVELEGTVTEENEQDGKTETETTDGATPGDLPEVRQTDEESK